MSTSDRDALARILKPHRRDAVSQDSGDHCTCGSDSRFEQRGGDLPWASMDRHRANLILTSDWLAEHDARVREQAARDALLSAADAMETVPWLDVLASPNWLRERAGAR